MKALIILAILAAVGMAFLFMAAVADFIDEVMWKD